MSRLLIGNFSFEQAWQPGLNVTLQVRRLEGELAPAWLAVAEPGDEIFCPEPIAEEFWERMEQLGCASIRPVGPADLKTSRACSLVPWGWTPAMREIVRRLKLADDAPPQEVIWQVNSREFAFACCADLDILLPGEGLARSLPQALEQIDTAQRAWGGWIVKPNQGQAGRGQLRGNRSPAGKELSTIERLIDRQGVVHVEPLLCPEQELSGQWDIPRQGEPRLLGLTQLFTDARGTYRGTGWKTLHFSPSVEEQILRSQREVVRRIQSAGYFGPVGIDAMIAEGDNEQLIRAVQDVNARWTMGRIGWEWGERFQRTRNGLCESGIWSHGLAAPDPDSLTLSPEAIHGMPVRQRMWWTSGTIDQKRLS